MANRPINVVIKGDYSDRDVKRAIKDLQSLQTRGDRTSKALRNFGIGAGVATAAVAAFAIKLGTDAVRAAMEEEESVDRLSTTMRNLGLATQDAGVEAFIDDMQFATGIADNDLRPAMDRLVRSTRDAGEAQRALGIAADIAVAKGRNVTDVANILGKAYDGNTMALGRLGVGLDKAVLKSGNMDRITRELSTLFEGQAANAADTLAGRMRILKIGMDELEESLGKGVVEGFFSAITNGTGNITDASDKLRAMQGSVETFGMAAGGTMARLLQAFVDFGAGSIAVSNFFADRIDGTTRDLINLQDKLFLIDDATADYMRNSLDMQKAGRDQALQNYLLSASGANVVSTTEDVAASTEDSAAAATEAARATRSLDDAWKALNKTLDKRAARSSMEAAIDAFGALDKTKSVGKGKNRRDVKVPFIAALNRAGTDFNLDKESGREGFDAAQALITATQTAVSAAGSDRARRRLLRRGRNQLARQLVGIGFGADQAEAYAGDYLTTPSNMLPTRAPRSIGMTEGAAGVQNTYNFYGDLNVASLADAAARAQEAKRLASLGGARYQGMADTGRGYRR